MSNDHLSTDEQRNLLLSVGTHRGRRPLSPIEVAFLFKKMTDAGADMSECARVAGLEGATQVARFMGLLRLSREIQHLVEWGKPDDALGFTTAFELSRLADAADQEEGCRAVLEHRFTSSEARQLVQVRRRSGKSLTQCVEGVVRMRPQIEVRHVFIGLVKAPGLQERLRSLSQHERDAFLAGALAGTDEARLASGRLGPQRFTLVGGQAFAGLLKSKGGEAIEANINKRLELGSDR